MDLERGRQAWCMGEWTSDNYYYRTDTYVPTEFTDETVIL